MFISQNAAQVGNAFFQFLIFFFDFFAFETGQAAQTHVEDGHSLFFAQSELRHKGLFGHFIRCRFTNGLDDFVNVVEGDEQAF